MAGVRKGVWMEKIPRYVSSVLVVLKVFCSLFPSPSGIPQSLGKPRVWDVAHW